MEALGELDHATDKAGPLGVLQVLVACPTGPHSITLADLAVGDSSHPSATVDIATLATHHLEPEAFKSLSHHIISAAKRRRNDAAFESL
jgi:hypothetical protein